MDFYTTTIATPPRRNSTPLPVAKAPRCTECAHIKNSIFAGLPKEQLLELECHKVSNLYGKTQVIFYEGNFPLGLYCVQSGRIKLYKSSVGGKHQIVRIAGPGDLLGYRALLAGERYRATAQALEDSRICFYPKPIFLLMAERNPTVAFHLAVKACRELGQAEQYLFDVVNKSVSARLADLLLFLMENFGKQVPGGYKIELSMSRVELADWIGTTPETLIRILSGFRKRGLLAIRNRELTICDPNPLAAIGRSRR